MVLDDQEAGMNPGPSELPIAQPVTKRVSTARTTSRRFQDFALHVTPGPRVR
jgi:hypothetical protein